MKAAFLIILGWYLILSAVSFAHYAWDKLAATRGTWRVPETRLLQIDLLGGWPGGLIAQQALRHKRAKRVYMLRFWIVVAAHAVAWGIVMSAWMWIGRG